MGRVERLQLREDILGCERCPLHESTTPVPLVGPEHPQVTILGEAPGAKEAEQGLPFIGAAGQRLRKLLRFAGFDPDEIGFANTVNCYPRDEHPDKPPGRTPLKPEIEACRPHKLAQLKEFGSDWVILTGNVPLQSFRPDLRIGRMHGRPFSLTRFGLGSAIAFPVYHPAAVLRNPAWEQPMLDDLLYLKTMIEGALVLGEIVPADCTFCQDRGGTEWDADCVVYCDEHISKGVAR